MPKILRALHFTTLYGIVFSMNSVSITCILLIYLLCIDRKINPPSMDEISNLWLRLTLITPHMLTKRKKLILQNKQKSQIPWELAKKKKLPLDDISLKMFPINSRFELRYNSSFPRGSRSAIGATHIAHRAEKPVESLVRKHRETHRCEFKILLNPPMAPRGH